MDYIHYNPVKHGYVKHPGDWCYGSFQSAQNDGVYPPDWGMREPENVSRMEIE
jgi:putative transposase